jgi:hypothetical protein
MRSFQPELLIPLRGLTSKRHRTVCEPGNKAYNTAAATVRYLSRSKLSGPNLVPLVIAMACQTVESQNACRVETYEGMSSDRQSFVMGFVLATCIRRWSQNY